MRISLILVALFFLTACNSGGGGGETPEPQPEPSLEEQPITGTYAPTDYEFTIPDWMPDPIVPEDNPMTQEGVALGRMLFYDPVLSRDSTMSCASCHRQELGFTDGLAVSTGIIGEAGRRSAMALINLAYNANGFFWDGRARTLEEQALAPIEDHIEMDDDWDNVELKLRRHSSYPALFRKAFGIEKKGEINRDLVVKAVAQFERTLISANSRYDEVIWNQKGFPTDEEQRGLELFFIEDLTDLGHPGCSHCHFNPFFTDNNYKNNGLDSVATLYDFPDAGLGEVSGRKFDMGKFRVPTLRNIVQTAPYMHDGRFNTLDEVLTHYSTGGKGVENEDANIHSFELTAQERSDLIAFLHMLTDTTFLNNPDFSNPFE